MQRIDNKVFKNESVELDGFAFFNCTFDGTGLIFRGQTEFGFSNPIFLNQSTIEFRDAAANTISALGAFYRSGVPALKSFADQMIESLKREPTAVKH